MGSNQGTPPDNLARALDHLAAIPGCEVVAVSPVYRTEPQLVRDQPWFANQVARLACAPEYAHEPVRLLRALARIEAAMGRTGEVRAASTRFGPRIIDLDILLMDGVECHTPELTVPHPRMAQRAFVLVPLRDVAPDAVLDNMTVSQALGRLTYRVEGGNIWQEST